MGWGEFLLAFATFFILHSVPVRPPVKAQLIAFLGRSGFTLIYSAVSLASLAWLIVAAARAPFVKIWSFAPWQSYVPLIVMLPVCILVALAIGRPNPYSFGGARNDKFEPSRPGVVRLTRHPLLIALALWSAAHMVPNGNLAHVVLFGTFVGFALLGGRLIDRRKRREMGNAWESGLETVRNLPPQVVWRPARVAAHRVLAGIGVYLILLIAHQAVIGVSPLP